MPTIDLGEYVVKCLKAGGDTLATYSFAATEGQVVALVGDDAPAAVKALDYWTAATMCEDAAFELAQKIAAGSWEVVSKRKPVPMRPATAEE